MQKMSGPINESAVDGSPSSSSCGEPTKPAPTPQEQLHRSGTCPTESTGDENGGPTRRPHRPSRRMSVATSAPASMTGRRMPRRSSLLASSYTASSNSSPDGTPPRRRPARRSSVTFSASIVTETKEVPKVECPVQRTEMFYQDADYTQFRWDDMREKHERRASISRASREREENIRRMREWRAGFGGAGAAAASPSAVPGLEREDAVCGPSPYYAPKITLAGAGPKSNGPTSSSSSSSAAAFAANFRRAPSASSPRAPSGNSYRFDSSRGFAVPIDSIRSHQDGCGSIVGKNTVTVSLPAPMLRPAGGRAGMA